MVYGPVVGPVEEVSFDESWLFFFLCVSQCWCGHLFPYPKCVREWGPCRVKLA